MDVDGQKKLDCTREMIATLRNANWVGQVQLDNAPSQK